MKQICMRYTRNENDTTEVLNQGFFKVFQNIARYSSAKASLYTWIRTIVINTCLDFIKQRNKAERHSELETADEVYISEGVIEKMDAEALLNLTRRLAPAAQAIFNLYVVEGYNHKEIGGLMNISEGTSKWYLSEARKALKHMIKLREVKYER